MSDPSAYVRERSASGRRDLTYPPLPEPVAVPVYDNHCHLEIVDGDDPLGLSEQLARAASAGIAGVVQASGDVESSRWAVWAAGGGEEARACRFLPVSGMGGSGEGRPGP